MSTTTLDPEALRFAAAVRRELSDLGSDEVDDLTDGLEADLTEGSEESGAADFGDPAAYAAELRSAAGLPPRRASAPARRGLVADLRDYPGQVASWWAGMRQRHPLAEQTTSFLVAIRPVWWLLRGWALYLLVIALFGGVVGIADQTGLGAPFRISAINVMVLVVSIILSVQWGRGRWMPWRGARTAVRVGSVLAAVALPFLLGWAVASVNTAASYTEEAWSQPVPSTDGLRQNGRAIDNVFAYDADGQPVSVRLYDQSGHELRVNASPDDEYWTTEDGTAYVPSTDSPRGSGWNVFPLQRVADRDVETGTLAKHSVRRDADAPYVSVPPLIAKPAASDAGADPTAGPTPAPTAAAPGSAENGGAAGPTGTPTATPSPSSDG